MTETSHSRSDAGYAPEPTAWTGWIVFSGIMLMMMGSFQAIEGLVAVFDDGFYRVAPSGLLVHVDYSTWGWVHLFIGVIAILAGLGLLTGNMVARIVGVAIAALSAVVNLAFISAYPVWSAIIIVIDVICIYAITVHGREVKAV